MGKESVVEKVRCLGTNKSKVRDYVILKCRENSEM